MGKRLIQNTTFYSAAVSSKWLKIQEKPRYKHFDLCT